MIVFSQWPFVLQELSKLILKSKREARNEKDLYQKMLGQAQKLEQKTKVTPPTQTTESSKVKGEIQQWPSAGRYSLSLVHPFQLKMWGYLVGAILIGVAGVAIYRYNIQ